MCLSLHARTTFWSCDVEKLHAAVARSTFSSQNRKKLTVSDHFLKLRCGKIARRCSEKHIFKSKCASRYMLGPLFEVATLKNCTPLWREAHFQVKIVKNWRSRTTFWSCDVEKLHAAVARSAFSIKMRLSLHVRTSFWSWDVEKLHAAVARSTFASQNAKKLTVSGDFLKCRCRKIVKKWHAAVAPSTCTSQNVQNTCVLRHFWRFHFASSLTN